MPYCSVVVEGPGWASGGAESPPWWHRAGDGLHQGCMLEEPDCNYIQYLFFFFFEFMAVF